MFVRAFLFALTGLALATPTAHAGFLDAIVPVYDASDGVTAGQGAHGAFIRFGPKAARLYRGLAGQTVTAGCGHPTKDDGDTATVGSSGPDGDRYWSERAGMTWTDVRVPKRRGRIDVPIPSASDVCFISAKQGRSKYCVDATHDDSRCAKVVVAVTAQGRTDIDERLRAIEVSGLFGVPVAEALKEGGADVVVLDAPDASPPAGKVGIFVDAQTTAAVTLLHDGQRRYMRQDGDVFSTNIPALAGGGTLSSLF